MLRALLSLPWYVQLATIALYLAVTGYGWKLFVHPRTQPMKKGLKKI